MIPPQPVQVQCPQCGQPFVAQVRSILDVGSDPEAKSLLLRGRLNVARCPKCNFQGMLTSPLLYHDPEKELALVYIPMELNMKREDQERLIGTMTNALIDSLPPAQRKGYLFQPKTLLSLNSLVEQVLAGEGVTREMMDAQRRQVDLINELADTAGDEAKLDALIDAHQADLTYEFFLTLRALADEAAERGEAPLVDKLHNLSEQLLKRVGQPDGVPEQPLPATTRPEELVDTLLKAEDNALPDLVALNRPLIDYGFFQVLTAQVDAAQAAGEADKARQLLALRARLLELTDEIDRQTQQLLESAARLLQTILQSPDPQKAVQEHLEEIDEAFLLVLSANVQQARNEGRTEIADALENLYGYVLSRLEARMPAEIQLVNRLLRLPDPAQRAELLKSESATAVKPEFLSLVETMAGDAEEHGEAQLASQLWQIADELHGSTKGGERGEG